MLQDGEIRRLGENRTQRLDLRVVAATNRPLDAEAAAGRFRNDLLYRLKVLRLTAPPLRDRGPDVAGLTDHCWKDIAAAAGTRATLARETVAALAAHPWPGNVRELQNVLANLTVTGPRYGPVGPDARPARCDSGRDRGASSESRAGAASQPYVWSAPNRRRIGRRVRLRRSAPGPRTAGWPLPRSHRWSRTGRPFLGGGNARRPRRLRSRSP